MTKPFGFLGKRAAKAIIIQSWNAPKLGDGGDNVRILWMKRVPTGWVAAYMRITSDQGIAECRLCTIDKTGFKDLDMTLGTARVTRKVKRNDRDATTRF